MPEALLREAVGASTVSPLGFSALVRALVAAGCLVRGEVEAAQPVGPPSLLMGADARPAKRQRRGGGEAVFFVAAGRAVAAVAAPTVGV
jgi:hypothetical protein